MAEIHFSTIKKFLSFIVMLLFLASCSIGNAEEVSDTTTLMNNAIDFSKPVPEYEWGLYKFPLLASLPEKELLLYGIWPKGVVLYTGDQGQFFDWEFYSPRAHSPKIFAGDFDHDGTDDIAITVYWKTGTGLSVEELHFLKPTQTEGILRYSDYVVTEDVLEVLLHDRINSSFYNNQITLIYNGEESVFDITEQISDSEKAFTFSDIYYTSKLSYTQDGDIIIASFSAAFTVKESVLPFYFATVTANVTFSDSGIHLDDIKILSKDIS